MGDHRTYPATERVVTVMAGDGLTLRVYENSRTVCTEAVLTQDEAHRLAQRLVNWSFKYGPWTLANDEPDDVRLLAEPAMPEFWPPTHGELWRDCDGQTYAVTKDGMLVPLDVYGDSPAPYWGADDFQAKLGPTRRIAASHDEVPF